LSDRNKSASRRARTVLPRQERTDFTRPDEATIAALLNAPRTDGISIAVGEPAPGVAGFRNSHAEALAARRLARLSQHRAGSVTRSGSVAVLAVVGGCGARPGIRVPRARPLDADDDAMARLRATLAVYFREGDVIAATAQRLGVHINTISYRLRQCEELLERPVKQRRFELEAALLLRDLMATSLAVAPREEPECASRRSATTRPSASGCHPQTGRAHTGDDAERQLPRIAAFAGGGKKIDPCFCCHHRAPSRADRAMGARAARRARAAVPGLQLDLE
jgi:hypothetical protein